MKTRHDQYVPILKWRQGQYIALERLKANVKEQLCPLLVIPPVEFDFEELRPKKTVEEHILPFPDRYLTKWGKSKAFIDLHDSLYSEFMSDGRHVLHYMFQELNGKDCKPVPVVKLANDTVYWDLIKSVASTQRFGVAFRLNLTDLMQPNADSVISSKMDYLEVERTDVDLILDLEQPESFEPYTIFANAIKTALSRLSQLQDFRSLIIAGVSIEMPGPRSAVEVTRHEWKLYQELVKVISTLRIPTFGDYTIESPEFIQEDMRKLNPAGKIVYTTDDSWYISKGTKFRGNASQMTDHCRNVVNSGFYQTPSYSYGDHRIMDTLNGIENNGNLGTWKKVGVNHHITFIVDQLSKFHGP
jgi:hypothetical protein